MHQLDINNLVRKVMRRGAEENGRGKEMIYKYIFVSFFSKKLKWNLVLVEHFFSYVLCGKSTHLLASSPPGGRLGMLSVANTHITWAKSGMLSTPCF